MVTIEKLFVEIFDRKKTIVDQVKNQIDLFDHHLASKCLLDGIPPPPWLFHSLSSDPNQLKKEELISGLLLPLRPQSVNRYSNSCYSICQKPFLAADNAGLRDGVFAEVTTLNKGINVGGVLSGLSKFPSLDCQCTLDGFLEKDVSVSAHEDFANAGISDISPANAQSLARIQRSKLNGRIGAGGGLMDLPQCSTVDSQCTSNGVMVQDVSVTSHQDCTDAGISDNCPDHVQSLVRMQRSKSRQRALELRNSAKAAKTHSCYGNNTDDFTSRIIGSGITCLRYDHADDSVLVKPPDANSEVCVEEEAIIGACEGEAKDSDIYFDRTMRCGNSGHQTSSMNEARNADNSSYVAKKDDHTESINRIVQQPNYTNESSKLLGAVTVKANSAAKEAKMGDCMGNESNVYIGRITRSRSSRSTMEESRNVGNSSRAAKKDSLSLNHANELLEMCDPSITVRENFAATETNMVGCIGNENSIYFGRITRSRSSSHQPNVKEPLDIGNSSIIVNEGSRLEEAKHRSAQEHDNVCKLSVLVKHSSVISNESGAAMKVKVKDNCNQIRGSGVYCGRLTRSTSSTQQTSSLNKSLRVAGACSVGMEDDCSKLKQQPNPIVFLREAVKPFDFIDESCQLKAKDLQRNEEGNDTHHGIITSSGSSSQQLDNVNEFPRVDTSSNIGKDDIGICEQSLEARQQLNLDGNDGVDLQEVLETSTNVLPCYQSGDVVDLKSCGAVVIETDSDSGGLIGACSVRPGSSLDDANLGVNVLVTKPSTESVIPLKPKQLDFDDVEECSLNESYDPALENKQKEMLPNEQDNTSQHCMDMLDTVVSMTYQEKPNLSVEMSLLEQNRISRNEEKPGKDSSEDHLKACDVLMDESAINTVQLERISTISRRHKAGSLCMGSWPQHKRIKRGNQLIDALSITPRLVIKPLQSIQMDHVELCLDERHITADNALMHEQPNVPSVSCLTTLAAGVSQSCLLEADQVADSTSIVFGAKEQYTAEEKHVMLQTEGGFKVESVKCSPKRGEMMLERNSEECNGNLSCFSVGSLRDQSMNLIDVDHVMPDLEGFVMEIDSEQPHLTGKGIDNCYKFDVPDTALERASVVEQLCNSACLHTPLSHFSTTYQLHKTLNLYQNNPLEKMELWNTLSMPDDNRKQLEAGYNCLTVEVNRIFQGRSHSDCLPSSTASSAWDASKICMSPFAKPWGGIISKSGSSEKRVSSIPELPCINEENENIVEVADKFEKTIGSEVMTSSSNREQLADITEDPNLVASVCETDVPGDRCSFASVNNEAKPKLRNQNSIKRRYDSKAKENKSVSVGANGVKRVKEPIHNRFSKLMLSRKTNLRTGGPGISEKEPKCNNIVSSITSFIPLVQQKQAAAVFTGKRDVKVKALEAAEAAKRLAEKKENERKMKKEALKLERARLEEQNLRQLELEKERKEEERKKKEADMAAKKRQREEEQRKERDRKRKRVEEARKQQLQHQEKLRAEKEINCRAADERAHEKGSKDKSGKHEKMEKVKGDNNLCKAPETEPMTTRVSKIDSNEAGVVAEDSGPWIYHGDNSKVVGDICKTTKSDSLISSITQEPSYEISPYKVSDDEDEDDDDDDDIPNSKYVPSWASSKSHVAVAVASQQKVDPESVFPPESFCNISEVLLPRRLQQK